MGLKELVQLRLAEALVGLEEAALQVQVAGRGNDWPGVAAWAHLSMCRAAALAELAELTAIESQSEAMRRATRSFGATSSLPPTERNASSSPSAG